MDYIRKLIQKDEKSKTGNLIQQISTDWVLEVLQGEDWGRAIPLRYNYIPLGRKTENTTDKYYELKFDDQTVSSHQAHLVWHPHCKKYGITHTRVPVVNQTYVNNEPIEPNKEVMLEDYYQIKMGKLIFVLSYKPKEQVEKDDTSKIQGAVSSISVNQQTEEMIYTGFTLKVIEGNEIGFEFPVIRRRIVIKRGNRPEQISADKIILSDRTVSRNQAQIVWQDEFKRLDVIHSNTATNPTKLIRIIGNRDRVIQLAPDEPEVLRNGDILAMGQTYIYVLEESIENKIKKIRELEEKAIDEDMPVVHVRTAEEEEAKSLGPRILEEPPESVPEEIIEEIIEDAIHEQEAHEAELLAEAEEKTHDESTGGISQISAEITLAGDIPDMPEETASEAAPIKIGNKQIVLEVQSMNEEKSDMMETTMVNTDETTSILTRKMD